MAVNHHISAHASLSGVHCSDIFLRGYDRIRDLMDEEVQPRIDMKCRSLTSALMT